MSLTSFLTILLMALGLAVQPWSVVAAILLVTSQHGVRKEIAFVIGWMLALSAVAAVTIAVGPQVPQSSSTTTAVAWLDIVLGLLLIGWLLRRRKAGPKATDSAKSPKWMSRVDSVGPLGSFVLGGFLPNYVLVVAAVGELLKSGHSGASLVVAAIVFVLVASLGVAAPLGVLVFRHDDAERIYASWRTWLTENSGAMLIWVGLVVGGALLTKGVVSLL